MRGKKKKKNETKYEREDEINRRGGVRGRGGVERERFVPRGKCRLRGRGGKGECSAADRGKGEKWLPRIFLPARKPMLFLTRGRPHTESRSFEQYYPRDRGSCNFALAPGKDLFPTEAENLRTEKARREHFKISSSRSFLFLFCVSILINVDVCSVSSKTTEQVTDSCCLDIYIEEKKSSDRRNGFYRFLNYAIWSNILWRNHFL